MPSLYTKKYPKGRRQTVSCQVCGKQFSIPNRSVKRQAGKFCSRECKAESQRSGQVKDCPICGKPMYIRASDRAKGKKYCSWECRKIGMRGNGNANWKNDPDYRGWDFKDARTKVLERDNYCCTQCGDNHLLCVHHITPWEYSHDNNLTNLITLCISCHLHIHREIKTS